MEQDVIPIPPDEPKFAVAWISNNNVVVVGPEDFCRRYCGRANEDETLAFYHVIPYTGPKFRAPRHPSSSFLGDAYKPIAPKVTVGITVSPETEEVGTSSAKEKVREYLAKIA